ncbi:hypothetical protein PVAG01_11285 [Phlyctema vagabunda]|uniref:Uncharacterized protein n=1 Tax=Phlyctema vagabunda TaxID=108571 RepID=A0ABR4P1V2_9HELO
MPVFSKTFGRRKSTANALEDLENLPVVAEPSFKVFNRTDTGTRSFDGGVKLGGKAVLGRPLTSPKHKEDNIFADIKGNRGSGASNTNTISTTDNSSRLSAVSTTPSSNHDSQPSEEWKSPHDKPFHDIPLPPVPKSAPKMSLKNAGRTLSWGRSKQGSTPPPPRMPEHEPPPVVSPPMEDEMEYGRTRAVTASSYASTATPPKLENKDLGLSLGGDFSDMFSGFAKRKSAILDAQKNREMSHSPEYYPSAPAPAQVQPPSNRSYSSSRLNQAQPAPIHIDRKREIEPSPYSWTSQNSHDGLISHPSPPPPVPQHATTRSTDTLPSVTARPQRPGGIPDAGLRRSSAFSARRQSTLEYGDNVDEDARLLRESVSASRHMTESSPEKSYSHQPQPSNTEYDPYQETGSSWRRGSSEATPRAKQAAPKPEADVHNDDMHDDNMFEDEVAIDPHLAEAAGIAAQFNDKPSSPPPLTVPRSKVMTKTQYERFLQDQERMRSVGGHSKEEEEDDDNYDDEEDEAEKNKQLAKQRRKQEAHMAVYRQQMMKVTGETAGPRPSPFTSQSTPNLHPVGKPEEGEEEDEEVPLAILAAHGFPNKGKPPNPQLSSMGSNPNLRAAAQSTGNNGALPVFARHLPQDPYLGAGLVHPANRESLAFGSGSVHGGPPRNGPPGGLVGVIATEERSRAMRRGTPNAQGEYPALPSNGFNGMGMPPMGRNSGGMMNSMGHSQADQAQIDMQQQMSQFMQMQMQMNLQMMQMVSSGQGAPSQNGQMPPSLGQQIPPRPGSSHMQGQPGSLRPGSSHQPHQRAMSMLDPNGTWMQGPLFAPSIHGQTYAPSIAPSERSNIGLPGRYRPVSHLPVSDAKSRASTMSGALNGWENKTSTVPTIKVVKRSGNISDEDDDEGWAEMKKKREMKKSQRKNKDDTTGLKEILNYGH